MTNNIQCYITNSLQYSICPLLVACSIFPLSLNIHPYLVGGDIIFTSYPNLDIDLVLVYSYYHVEVHVYHLFWVNKSYLFVRIKIEICYFGTNHGEPTTSSSSSKLISLSQWHVRIRSVVSPTLHRGQRETRLCLYLGNFALLYYSLPFPQGRSLPFSPWSMLHPILVRIRGHFCHLPGPYQLITCLLPPLHPNLHP